jgi:hypothetical protein
VHALPRRALDGQLRRVPGKDGEGGRERE